MGFLEKFVPMAKAAARVLLANKQEIIHFAIDAAKRLKASSEEQKQFAYEALVDVKGLVIDSTRTNLEAFFAEYDMPVLEGEAEAQVEAEITRVITKAVTEVFDERILARFEMA